MTPSAIATLAPPEKGTITFADGLPGFERHRGFVLVASPAFDPFTCLQGIEPDAPSFLAIDPRRIMPGYRCVLAEADRARLDAGPTASLVWLALVRPAGGGTVNLRAPVVINPVSMRGVQIVHADDTYPLDHPLGD
jgi:flagellar assembly factor FliW